MNAQKYTEELYKTIFCTEIKDGIGKKLGFNDGIDKIMQLLINQTAQGKKVLFVGNGGSAAIASHEAIDFLKNGKMRALCFNEAAMLTCLGNDYGYDHVFEKPIEMFGDPGDVLVAISSSGMSQNILLAVEKAKEIGFDVITFSGFDENNTLRKTGDYNVYVPAHSYGYVEVAHQTILHMILDLIMEAKQVNHDGKAKSYIFG